MCNQVRPMSKEHFQYAKGIAILAVIVSHIGNYSGKTWFTPLGGIGVALFLFCSGYGLMVSFYQKGLEHFWKNKFLLIYLPFMIVEIISAIIHKHPIQDVLLDLVFLKRLNPLGWYLQYLVVCYILFYIVVKIIPNVKYRFYIWGFSAILSFVIFPNLQGEQAISFISGLMIAEVNRHHRLSWENKKAVIGGGDCNPTFGLLVSN